MNRRPFFSIPIATYNRVADLEFALRRILAQNFKDFEVIVSDDNSNDETKKMVLSFKDKRIRYFKNKKNLGAVKNIGKGLTYVRGKYVFLHGDDDFLLFDNALQEAYKLFTKGSFGLVRFNYLYQSLDKKSVFDYFRNKFTDSDTSIKPKRNPLEILEFMENIDPYFITGIIFKNPYPTKIKIIDSELVPWFGICYKNILSAGGYYDSAYKIIASWSKQGINPVFYVKEGKLPFENLYEEIKNVSGEKFYKRVLKRQLDISVSFLASIKYHSNNKNLLKYAKRILELEPAYNSSLKFWSFLVISFLSPKVLLRVVRFVYIRTVTLKGKSKNLSEIVKRVRTLRGYA